MARTAHGEHRSGVLLALTAVLLWGSQFPVGKSLLESVDPYTLTAIRYAIACLVFVILLRIVEGPRAVRYDDLVWRASVAGALGIGLGILVVYVGLQHTQPTTAAVVLATQPLMTAIVLRLGGAGKLPWATWLTIAIALVGVLLVITRGAPGSLLDASTGWGFILVLAGSVGWVLYTIESASFRGWSPLRYTAMTGLPGTLLVVAVAGVAALTGLTHPVGGDVTASPWALSYSVAGPAVLAILTWNWARPRLGAQSLALFMNLVPVVTFGIEIIQGYQVRALELAGAALTIGALTANNIVQQRAARRGEAAATDELTVTALPAPEPL